jgi:pectin methylesterase-like acyl-CoA thioesterase
MLTTLLAVATRPPRAWPAVPIRVGLALLAGLAAWGVLGPPAEAAVCNVPGDVATIQAAVDKPSCTTITVAAGTYKELITINRNVTIRGAGQDLTILDGNIDGTDGGDGTVVTITGGTVSLEGVTITGGSATEGGGLSIGAR